MSLKREYDDLDGELKHLICGSDEEIAQLERAAHPTHVELPETPDLSPRESARMVQQIETNSLVREVLGSDSPSVLQVDASPLGLNGKPLGFYGKAKSMAELETDFQRLMKAVITGVERGDPEALRIAGRSGTTETTSFVERMAERADEFLPDSVAGAFIKAFANNDRAGMRAAVRPLAQELVAAEA
jgi:hypothetical protein